MAQKENRIQFSIDFKKGDTKALRELKNDLAEIQQMASQNVQGSPAEDLNKITTAAHALESALNQAFDPDLNTVNVQKFNQVLRQSGMNAETLYKDLSMAGIAGQQAFLKMSGQLMQFNTAIKQSNEFLNGLATTFFNTIKWSVMSSIVNNISGTIQKSFYYIKDLDRGLNDIRIVTGKSADEMERFAVTANDAAKALSVSTEDFTKGALIYYQQGLDDETATQLAEITAKTANVTGQGMDAVSEELTAVWNGYQVANQAAEEGIQVYEEYVDKMAAVGATTASDLEELSTAMSKVASAAAAMGVNFDDLNAQIATIVSVTRQAPESVGTALKTIYARLGDLKIDGVDEFGVKLGEVSQQLQDIGINVLDQNGNLRNMSDVIAEVADHWNTWTDAQRQAAAVAMAGKRQYNNLIALFDNQEMHEEALATSMGAVGTLNEQQAIAAESLAKKMEKMAATAEDLYDNLFDEDSLIGLVEAGTNALQLLADFTESVGGLKNLLPMLGSLGLQVFNEQIGKGLANIVINAQTANREIMTMQESQQALQAMFSSSTFVSGAGANTAALKESAQELYSYYQQMAPYQSAMTKEQKEQYNNILNLKVEAGNLSVELEKQAQHQVLNTKHMQYVNTAVVENLKDTKAITEETTKLNQIIDLIDKHIYNPQSENVIDDIGIDLINIGETLKLDDDMILQIIDKIERAATAEGDVEAGGQKIINELVEVRDALASMQVQQSKVDSLDNSFKKLGNTLLKTSQLTKTISDFTALAGAMGQVASMVNTFQNLEEVWSDENLTDAQKQTQTIMNLSFVMTGFISILGTLKKTAFGDFIVKQLEAVTAARHAHDVTLAASKIVMDANTASIVESITAEEARSIANGETTLAETIKQKAEAKGIEITTLDTKAIEENTIAKITNAKATDAQAAAESSKNALSGVMTSLTSQIGATGIVGIVVGIIALITTAVLKAANEQLDKIEELREAREEEIASIEKERQKKIEEIETNQKLTQSYIDLYSQYEQGKIGKEQLANASEEIIKILGKENVAIATLTGNYELLNDKLKEVREQELNAKIEADQQAMNESVTDIEKNVLGKRVFNPNASAEYIAKQQSSLTDEEKQYFNYQIDQTGSGAPPTVSIADNLPDNFDPFEFVKALQKIGADQVLISTAVRDAANYITAERDQNLVQIEKDLTSKNLENIDNYSDYERILNDTIQEVQKQSGYSDYNAAFDKALEIISRLSGNNDKFEARALTQKAALDKYIGKDNATDILNNLMDSLSNEDLGLIIQGKVQISEKDTEESVRKSLDVMEQTFAKEDLSVAVSLRTKLTSDKNLTQKQIKEMLEEEGKLGEYDQLYDFENESDLQKIDSVNSIVEEQIRKNEELADSGIEAMKKQVEEYEKAQERLNQLNNAKSHRFLDEKETEEQEQLSEYIETTTNEYNEQNNAINNFDYGQNAFDNLIAGMEGVISEAKILKDLAEEVGENQTIAAEDIEHFGRNFPEIVADSENYNISQENGLQLTKQGQELFAELIEQRKADLIAKNESYKLELQQQADARIATAEYYEAQAQHLKDYLNGQKTAAETESAMKGEVATYAGKLAKITGENEADLQKQIQENLNNTANKATEDTSIIYDDWVAVGKAAEAASLAYDNQVFNDPNLRPSGSAGGTNVTSYKELHKEGDYAYTSSFSQEEIDRITAQIESLEQAAEEERHKGEIEYSKIAALDAKINEAKTAMDNAVAGKGGKGSKSSSKDAKFKDKKEYKDEFNRYFDIEKAIEDVDYAVKQLEKDQKNLHGKGLIESLQKENELIEKQTENYEKLYELQKEEAKELIGKLKGLGLAFDDSGAITNYAEATKKALDDYNKAVAQYNVDQNDEVFEIHEKAYEDFKKTLERYESLYYKEMKDTQDKIDDNNRKVLENNLKGWEVEIELRLETNKMERDWNNFLRKINKDYKKVFKDLGQEMQDLIAQTGELEKDQAVYLDELDDVTAEIDKMVAGEGSGMFENIDQAKEKLKELYDQIISNGEDIYDLQQEAWDNYLESIDQAADKFEVIEDGWERINDELEFEKQLIELIYGEKAYDLMGTYYKGQEGAMRGHMESLKSTADMWHQLQVESGATMGNQLDQTEDQQKYYEQQQEAQKSLKDQLLDYIKLIKEDYLNAVDKVLDDLDKKIQGARGLDAVEKQWENVKQYSDKYLDDVEKSAAIQKLMLKYNAEIEKTDDSRAKAKLEKQRDEELKYLKEKDKLSQFDVEYAEKKLEVATKEAALEEAKNSKNKMMLTRNELGNQSYQYVADEEDVEDKKQELLQAQEEMYKMSKEQMQSIVDEEISIYKDFVQEMQDITQQSLNGLISPEEAEQRYTEAEERYNEKRGLLADDAQTATGAMASSGAGVLMRLGEEYGELTAEEQRLTELMTQNGITSYYQLEQAVKGNLYGLGEATNQFMASSNELWTSSALQIISQWNGEEDSIKTNINAAITSIKDDAESYREKMDEVSELVGIDLGEEGIQGRIMDVEIEEDLLGQMTQELTKATHAEIEKQKSYLTELEGVWRTVEDAVKDAIAAINEYLRKVAEANVKVNVGITGNIDASSIVAKPSSISATVTKKGKSNTSGSTSVTKAEEDNMAKLYVTNESGGIISTITDTDENIVRDIEELKKEYAHGYGIDSKGNLIEQFATGGYTGNQGSDEGRLAILHEKELVLNEKDTDNLLEMVKMIRYSREEMMSDFQEMEYMLHESVAKMQTAQAVNSYKDYINAIGNMAGGPVSGDTFYIDKLEFPNANSVNEIREAILTLPNIASQYVGKNRK